jgi:hypothetical protein
MVYPASGTRSRPETKYLASNTPRKGFLTGQPHERPCQTCNHLLP